MSDQVPAMILEHHNNAGLLISKTRKVHHGWSSPSAAHSHWRAGSGRKEVSPGVFRSEFAREIGGYQLVYFEDATTT